MLKKISTKIQNINLMDLLKNTIILILKAQIFWTVAYVITSKTFGVAYCAPGWMRLFQDEKPPTILDALQNTDITIGKILFLTLAGYALFKGVEYGVKMGFDVCKGVWEGYTGKRSNLTVEEKIDFLYNNVNTLRQSLADLNTQVQTIFTTLKAIDQNHVEFGFNGVFDELASIKNGGESLNRVLNDIDRNLEALAHNGPMDFTAQELNRMAQQLEQMRVSLLNANNSLNPAMDSVLSRIESFAMNLEERSREELAGISAELRTNMGHIRHIVEQNTTILNNPILNEEIIVPQSVVHSTTARNTGGAGPTEAGSTIRHGARRMGTVDTPPVEPNRMGTSNIPLQTGASNTNQLVVTGLEPGTYTLEILAGGGVHIDPVAQQNISSVAGALSNPNSPTRTFLSGIAGVALHPEVQNAVISYGARMLTQPRQSSQFMPPVPYYPPMVPYGYYPPGSMPGASTAGDVIARAGGDMGETVGKVIGRFGGAIFKGILGGF